MNYDDIVDIADLDCIYLSYDEPQKEEFWIKIKNMVPWAKRVDGVKGSDAAHKAAGEASETERFILIDGDNMPNEDFFNLQLDFTDKDPNYKLAQYRWRAVNAINGLRYGNGGMSSWTKTYVANMKTHETSDGSDTTAVDFCMDSSDNLYVGADVENGLWAIYGARLGTHMTMLTDWDYKDVADFDNYPALWGKYKNHHPELSAGFIGEELEDKLGLPMCTLDAEQSKFFKRHYNADKHNLGPLVKEMDVIRRIEGW